MNSTNNVKIKSSKPPPPVPPRPSKSLIKEALAKTNRARYIVNCLPRAPESQKTSSENVLSSSDIAPPQQPTIALFNGLLKKHDYNGDRPVIYQSDNYKNRKNSQELSQIRSDEKNSPVQSRQGNIDLKDGQPERLSNECGGEQVAKKDIESEKVGCDLWRQKASQQYIENNVSIILDQEETSVVSHIVPESNENDESWKDILNRNQVNTLIDEMFASVLETNSSKSLSCSSSTESIIKDNDNNNIMITNNTNDNNSSNLTVILINDEKQRSNSKNSERKVKFNDRQNHEFLINELQNMKHTEGEICKRQRISSLNSSDEDSSITDFSENNIQRNDWYSLNEGKTVKMSSCHIKVHGDSEPSDNERYKLKKECRISDLPPLPKSLSSFDFMKQPINISSNTTTTNTTTKSAIKDGQRKTTIEEQLAILWSEMKTLREQDLSLLSKLWFLNESIQDFRHILQEQEDQMNLSLCVPSTPSSIEDEHYLTLPPPTASSC